jgi:crotonobetainyl-CoA:carnitine CoA-transferase CaiB-like acyl-CoA transferase
MPRSAHTSIAPVQSVRTADGWIYVMCMKDKFWHALAERIGRHELLTDTRFCDQAARRANRDQLTHELDTAMRAKTTSEWMSVLAGAVPAAPIYAVDQAFSNPFMLESGMVTSVNHPAAPALRVLASPLKVDGQRLERAACSALGADNERYLSGARHSQTREQRYIEK